MPFISSPLAYPPSSSPMDSPRKKRKLDERDPLRPIHPNTTTRTVAGFLIDESEDDSDQEDAGYKRFKKDQAPYLTPTSSPPLATAGETASEAVADGEEHPKKALQGKSSTDGPMPDVMSFELGNAPSLSLKAPLTARTGSGNILRLYRKSKRAQFPYEQLVAERSVAVPGRARKAYYGIDIHGLIESAQELDAACVQPAQQPIVNSVVPSVEQQDSGSSGKILLWTEKYRARKFTDLVGDERTHRAVLRWLKSWDSIVFPGAARLKPKSRSDKDDGDSERAHRKLLLLTGPPGLGKTTLAHVCAKQAGYEVQEINASDERSRDVVKGRIRDMVGTENVRPVEVSVGGKGRKSSRPVCVVVDEVDGVVGGSSGGDGGFVKALMDLIALDQRNSSAAAKRSDSQSSRKPRKGDNFRLLRPLILICNDVYHPALRLLRQGTSTEIIHVRKPTMNMIVPRLQSIFEREGVPCDSDAARRLCEASWGAATRKDERQSEGSGEGDIRSILVVAEWVATKLKTTHPTPGRLSRQWIEQHILSDLVSGGGSERGLGRGSSREIVERVFTYNAGFPASSVPLGSSATTSKKKGAVAGVADSKKSVSLERLHHLIRSSGEDERIMTGEEPLLPAHGKLLLIAPDCFASYPTHLYQDDTMLTKPNLSYEWLHFYDSLSSAVREAQEWELSAYLAHPILAFHHLFASSSRAPNLAKVGAANSAGNREDNLDSGAFSGVRASYAAHEAEKANRATIQILQTQLSLPLRRTFRSHDVLAAELLPYTVRMLNPDIKPVMVGGSGSERGTASVRRATERELARRAVDCMIACGVRFERSRVEYEEGTGGAAATAAASGWIYRMEPPLDALGVFETNALKADTIKVRYAVRQVLEQEWRKETALREQQARLRRGGGGNAAEEDEHNDVLGKASTGYQSNAKGTGESQTDEEVRSTTITTRDFFGRTVAKTVQPAHQDVTNQRNHYRSSASMDKGRIWVTYHEGYSNAVRKGLTLKELMEGL